MPDKAEQFSSDESTEAALQAAIAADAASEAEEQATYEGTPSTDAPAEKTETTETETEQTEEGTQPPKPVSDLWDGTPVNPDELIAEHPELAPLVHQFQAAWTKKTQSLAEQRKQLESLGDMESIQQAVELSNRISDPQNWPALHKELQGLMKEYGLTAEEAAQVVAESEEPDLSDIDTDDPDTAKLYNALQAMQSKLDTLDKERAEAERLAREEAEAEQWHNQILAEVTRAENTIMESHPHYNDDDMNEIHMLSSFFNGDLFAAQRQFEANNARRLQQYLDRKAAATKKNAKHVKAPGAATHTEQTEPMTGEALKNEMEETMRRLQAAGEFDDDTF